MTNKTTSKSNQLLHYHDIIHILNLQYLENIIEDVKIVNTISKNIKEFIFTFKKNELNVCPRCGSITTIIYTYRKCKLRHLTSSFSDIEKCYVVSKLRRFKCKDCSNHFTESNPVRHYNSMTIKSLIKIVDFLTMPNHYYIDTAMTFNFSVNTIRNIVEDVLDIKRPTLPKVFAIDEIFTGKHKSGEFSTVLVNTYNSSLLAILKSRKYNDLYSFFSSYSEVERSKVQFVVADMNKTYAKIIGDMFPNARLALDSFHIVKMFNELITTRINQLKHTYVEFKGKEHRKSLNYWKYNFLCQFQFFLRSNEEKIKSTKYKVKGLDVNLNVTGYYTFYWSDIEILNFLLSIDKKLEKLYRTKEEYVTFNKRDYYKNNIDYSRIKRLSYEDIINSIRPSIIKDLIEIITSMRNSEYSELRNLATTLEERAEEIVTSFVKTPKQIINKNGTFSSTYVRLNSGTIERKNREIKRVLNASGTKLQKKEMMTKLVLLKLNPSFINY